VASANDEKGLLVPRARTREELLDARSPRRRLPRLVAEVPAGNGDVGGFDDGFGVLLGCKPLPINEPGATVGDDSGSEPYRALEPPPETTTGAEASHRLRIDEDLGVVADRNAMSASPIPKCSTSSIRRRSSLLGLHVARGRWRPARTSRRPPVPPTRLSSSVK
jgi:hypothetical protein